MAKLKPLQQPRLFAEWENGSYVSTLDPDFAEDFAGLVEQYGPPDKVEYRP